MAQWTTAMKQFIPGIRRGAESRSGFWLLAAYRLCIAFLTVAFVQSIHLAAGHKLTRLAALGLLSYLMFVLPLTALLLALGRRRGERYAGDGPTVTWIGICAFTATVLVLCVRAMQTP